MFMRIQEIYSYIPHEPVPNNFDINNPIHYGLNISISVKRNGELIGAIVFTKNGFYIKYVMLPFESLPLSFSNSKTNKKYRTKDEATQKLYGIWKSLKKNFSNPQVQELIQSRM